MKTRIQTLLLATLLGLVITANAPAQTTAFTYQGQFNDHGVLFTGTAEFQLTLWNAASGSAAVATNNPAQFLAPVSNGLFSAPLDFGDGIFDGGDRSIPFKSLLSQQSQPTQINQP